jgi:hypothetical protein
MAVFWRLRFKTVGLGFVVCLMWAAATSSASAAVQAKTSDALVESIGVNTHLNYDDTPYGQFEKVRQSLAELGIRNIRDQVGLHRPDINAHFRQLATEGVHLDVIAGDPQERWGTGTVSQQLDVIQNELAGSVTSIEGPNEYDLSGYPNWASELRTYTRELAEGVRSRPKLASLPIIAPSIVMGENEEKIGNLTPWITDGNTHTYMGGEMPETSRWNEDLAAVSHFAGTDPVVATETGYQNAVNTTNGHLPTSERATAIYMPRLLLENFRRGIGRSYMYELLDESNDPSKTNIEASFGLLRSDFSKKPAAVAVQNLISLLSDKGASFTPGSLEYTLQGAPASAQQVLLQKRDGSFYLAVWNRVSVWDRFGRVDLEPASVPITIRLGQSISSAEVFEPNRSANAVYTAANPQSLSLSLSPRVQIIKLTPSTSATPNVEEPPTSASPVTVPAPPAELPVEAPAEELPASSQAPAASASSPLPPIQTEPATAPVPAEAATVQVAARQQRPKRVNHRQRGHGKLRAAVASAQGHRTAANAPGQRD